MKITEQHHKQLPYLKRLTKSLDTEQMAILESLLDLVFREGHLVGYRTGNPNWDED